MRGDGATSNDTRDAEVQEANRRLAFQDTLPRPPDPDENRDTLPSIDVTALAREPFVIELRVELPWPDDFADPTSRIVEAISQSLQERGWKPATVSPQRSYRAPRFG
jgi:hypothetical protein